MAYRSGKVRYLRRLVTALRSIVRDRTPGLSVIVLRGDSALPAQVDVIVVGDGFPINGHDLLVAVGFELAVW